MDSPHEEPQTPEQLVNRVQTNWGARTPNLRPVRVSFTLDGQVENTVKVIARQHGLAVTLHAEDRGCTIHPSAN